MAVYRTYKIKSDALNQYITVNQLSPTDGSILEITTDDGTKYSPYEVNMLRLAGVKIDRGVHLLKKVFGGMIVKVEDKK